MRTNSQAFFTETSQTVYNKSTHQSSVTLSRPQTGSAGLTVFADQLHGDRKTIYTHEFRRHISSDYVGTFFRDTPSDTLNSVGQILTWSRTPSLPDPLSMLRNSALGDLYDKIRSGGVGSGLDLSVDIAEAHQVKKLWVDSLKLIRHVRSFHPREWHKHWLAYQYGARPLFNSVYGTLDALMHRRTFAYARVKGKARDRSWSQSTYKDTAGPGSLEIVSAIQNVRYEVVAEFEIGNSFKQQLGGYTSLNPVSILWELTPYSFVADWLIDVGGYLRALEGALAYGTGFKRGYEVGGYLSRLEGTLTNYQSVVAGTTRIWQAEGYEQYSYKRRVPVGSVPMPTLPSFQVNLGWQRLVSAASLLRNFIGRK